MRITQEGPGPNLWSISHIKRGDFVPRQTFSQHTVILLAHQGISPGVRWLFTQSNDYHLDFAGSQTRILSASNIRPDAFLCSDVQVRHETTRLLSFVEMNSSASLILKSHLRQEGHIPGKTYMCFLAVKGMTCRRIQRPSKVGNTECQRQFKYYGNTECNKDIWLPAYNT